MGLLPRTTNQEVAIEAPHTELDIVVFRPDELLRVTGVVVDGRPVEIALAATVGRARLRFVDPHGRPVTGLHLWVDVDGLVERPAVPPTDHEGVTTVVGTPGTWSLACHARPARDRERYREHRQALLEKHGGSQDVVRREMDALVVQLPPITLTAGEPGEPLEIRLPPEWER